VRLVPYVCGFAVFGSFFLIASLGRDAVYRFFIVLIIISLLYLVYGVHAAQFHDDDLDNRRACAPGPGPAAMTAPRAPREWGGAGARQLF